VQEVEGQATTPRTSGWVPQSILCTVRWQGQKVAPQSLEV